MDLEITVLLVTAASEPTELVEQLEERGLFVETTTVSELPSMLPVVAPDLVVHVGADGAGAVAAHLGDLPATSRVRLAIVAEREALPGLRRLDREVVVTLLSDDVPRDALTGRLATIGRRLAQQAHKLRSSAPPATRRHPPGATPRPQSRRAVSPVRVPPAERHPEPAVSVPQAAKAESARGRAPSLHPDPSATAPSDQLPTRKQEPPRALREESGLARLGAPEGRSNKAEAPPPPSPRLPPSPLPAPPVDIPVSEGLEVVPGVSRGSIRSVVIADDDVMRGDRLAQALRMRGIQVQMAPLDPAATKWPVLRESRPDALLADGARLKSRGVVWLQLFRADAILERASILTVPFRRLFDETTGAVTLDVLEPELGTGIHVLGTGSGASQEPASAGTGLSPDSLPEEDDADDDRPTLIAPEGGDAFDDDRPTIAQEPMAPRAPAVGASQLKEEDQAVVDEPGAFEAPQAFGAPGAVDEPAVVATPQAKPSGESAAPSETTVDEKRRSKGPLLAVLAIAAAAAAASLVVWPHLLGWREPEAQPPSDDPAAASPPQGDASEPVPAEPEAAGEAPNLWVVPPETTLPPCDQVVEPPEGGVSPATIQRGSVAWDRARRSLVQGDFGKAHIELCEAALHHPQSLALEGLAELYLRFHQPSIAEQWASKAIEQRPDRNKTLQLMGDTHSQLGNAEAALASFARALNVSQDDTRTLSLVAEQNVSDAAAALARGDLARAEMHSRRAASLSPESGTAAASMARVMLALDRLELARLWVQRALELQDGSPDAHVAAGDLARAEGNKDLAAKHYDRAIEIKPGHSAAWRKKSTLDD